MGQITVFSGPERRRRWNDEERQEILNEAFAPGACVAEVARRHDVSTALVYTLEGAFGRLLDAAENRLRLSDVQCFETETLMNTAAVVLPVLTYLFHRLEERFDGRPTLLVLDEAWVFLDNPLFAARTPDLAHALADYSVLYNRAYADKAEVVDLIPAMLESFLASDRAFAKARREAEAGT